MSGASHRLEQSSRAYNYGFDVSKLYEREEKGRKDWRAEVVPTDDEKDRAKAAVVAFKAEFPLGGGTLDGIFEAHRAHVSRLLEHGPRHQRAWYAQRLESESSWRAWRTSGWLPSQSSMTPTTPSRMGCATLCRTCTASRTARASACRR